jgi:hypothetical protein
MVRILRAGALALAIAGVAAAQEKPPAAGEAEVPVREVVLFSSGVGYFEHEGTVVGNVTAELRFKATQINDVLKSLVLDDEGGGKIGPVIYPSQEPIARTLKSFQVDITGNPSRAELLNQLRGAKVHVSGRAGNYAGTVLGVEKKETAAPRGEVTIETFVLNLYAQGAVTSLLLDDVETVTLDDAALQSELEKALAALAQSRDQDKKPVTLRFEGKGERCVRVGYVVETPVWKTSYRLILPADKNEKPRIQGWAIVENQTDNDWNGIRLSLVSGRPISFIQELYSPLYIPRPVVEPEIFASLRPQTYGAGMTKRGEGEMDKFAARENARRRALKDGGGEAGEYDEELAKGAAPAAPPPAVGSIGGYGGKRMEATRAVASVAQAEKMGELFRYSVAGVTLPRQRSAMIPIVTDEIEAERVSIYNRAVLARNPLNGARLKNNTGKHLLQGPITVLDGGAYAGDARIEDLPPGQERLLSYAVDLKVLVDSTSSREESSLVTGKILKGVLRLTRKHVATQDYVIENKDEKEKQVVVEHPFRRGWRLVDSPEPIETTESLYRFKGAVGAGKTSKLTVKEELVSEDSLAILPADLGQLEFYSKSGEIPKDVRAAIEKAMKLKMAVSETERQIQERQRELGEIAQEQSRIRANMGSADKNTQYYQRLLNKLNEQETAIEKKQSEIDALREKRDGQRKELEGYLQELNAG